MLTADLGWEVDVGRHFTMRVSLGGAFTMSADSHLAVYGEPPRFSVLIESVRREIEQEIDFIFPEFIHLPSMTVTLSYKFH